jgi:hypothetical protein
MSLQQRQGTRRAYQLPKLYWLELSNQADAIVAAGRLTRPAEVQADDDSLSERHPNIAVDEGGTIRVVYLVRRAGESRSRLCSAELEPGPERSGLRLKPNPEARRTLGRDLAIAPLFVSPDGRRVFGSAGTGAVVSFSLPSQPR